MEARGRGGVSVALMRRSEGGPCGGGTALRQEGRGSYTNLPRRTELPPAWCQCQLCGSDTVFCVRATAEENWVKGPSSLQLPTIL